MKNKYNKELIHRARNLRKEATKEENHLWYDFLKNYPLKFVRQKIIGNYIVDFYCASCKVAIEIDGSHHYETENYGYDVNRTSTLNSLGVSVLRFTNAEINCQFEAVCAHIDHFVKVRGRTNVINESIVDRF